MILMLEHQSTLNYNMPLRMLIYLARQYEKNYRDKRIYKKERIKINMPLFYVMYNGEEDIEPISTMKLSEAFDCAIHDKTIEMIVTVFNLNKLDQIQMLCDCATLAGYSTFVTLVRNYRKSWSGYQFSNRRLYKEWYFKRLFNRQRFGGNKYDDNGI